LHRIFRKVFHTQNFLRSSTLSGHPSGRSQNLGKLQNLEKCMFCWLAGGPKPWKNCNTWKHAFFAGLREGPTLSNAIRPYPKPGKNCKTWKNAFFAGFREGPKAIQRYPSLSQTMEKMQNLEKCIFCGFRNIKKMMKSQKQLFWEMPKNDFSWVWLKITTFCRETVTGPNGHPNAYMSFLHESPLSTYLLTIKNSNRRFSFVDDASAGGPNWVLLSQCFLPSISRVRSVYMFGWEIAKPNGKIYMRLSKNGVFHFHAGFHTWVYLNHVEAHRCMLVTM